MPRFVIQEHRSDRASEHRTDRELEETAKRTPLERSEHCKRASRHFDLMLESNGVLKTWSLDKPPMEYRAVRRLLPVQPIKALPDHRMAYLTYEGKISRNRGSVKIWDKGVYQKIIWKNSFRAVVLKGQRIAGMLIILPLPLRHRLRLLPLIRFL